MSEEEKERDFVKERLKGLYEYLRICALFVAGLTTTGAGFLLRNDVRINDTVVWFILFNTIALIVVFVYLFKTLFEIDENFVKLKNL